MESTITNMYQCIHSMLLQLTERHDDLKSVQHRDKLKQMLCEHFGISLITIPFWWNKTIESVALAIHAIRPDLSIPLFMLKGVKLANMPKQIDKSMFHLHLIFYLAIYLASPCIALYK